LRRNDLVIARHDGDNTKLQTLCEMHGSDRELTRCDLDPVAEFRLSPRAASRQFGSWHKKLT
jgi:hypothetical protein